MSTPRPATNRIARLALAGLALPLGGLATLATASPAGALEPHVLSIEKGAQISEENGGFITLELSGGPADQDIEFTTTSNLQYSYTDAIDFVAVDVLGTLPAGETSVQVPVMPFDDDLIEGFEQFHVGITSISGPADAAEETTASIVDEERAYLALTIGDAEVQELDVPEGDDADTVVPVTVHVSDPLANSQSVGIGIQIGGCTTTTDDDLYVFNGGTVEIQAGAHKAQGSIIVHGDTKDELDECAEVWVSAYDMNMFHEMGDNQAILTIVDDDDTVLGDAPDDEGGCPELAPVCDQLDNGTPDGGDTPEDEDVPADGSEPAADVDADDATQGGATLPRTGSSTTLLAIAGAALVALGTGSRKLAKVVSR